MACESQDIDLGGVDSQANESRRTRRRRRNKATIDYQEMSVRYGSVKLQVPPGFKTLLEHLAREVLRDQPKDIPEFAAAYFSRLVQRRADGHKDPYLITEKMVEMTPEQESYAPVQSEITTEVTTETIAAPAVEEEEEMPDLGDPEVQKAATLIQASFRGFAARKPSPGTSGMSSASSSKQTRATDDVIIVASCANTESSSSPCIEEEIVATAAQQECASPNIINKNMQEQAKGEFEAVIQKDMEVVSDSETAADNNTSEIQTISAQDVCQIVSEKAVTETVVTKSSDILALSEIVNNKAMEIAQTATVESTPDSEQVNSGIGEQNIMTEESRETTEQLTEKAGKDAVPNNEKATDVDVDKIKAVNVEDDTIVQAADTPHAAEECTDEQNIPDNNVAAPISVENMNEAPPTLEQSTNGSEENANAATLESESDVLDITDEASVIDETASTVRLQDESLNAPTPREETTGGQFTKDDIVKAPAGLDDGADANLQLEETPVSEENNTDTSTRTEESLQEQITKDNSVEGLEVLEEGENIPLQVEETSVSEDNNTETSICTEETTGEQPAKENSLEESGVFAEVADTPLQVEEAPVFEEDNTGVSTTAEEIMQEKVAKEANAPVVSDETIGAPLPEEKTPVVMEGDNTGTSTPMGVTVNESMTIVDVPPVLDDTTDTKLPVEKNLEFKEDDEAQEGVVEVTLPVESTETANAPEEMETSVLIQETSTVDGEGAEKQVTEMDMSLPSTPNSSDEAGILANNYSDIGVCLTQPTPCPEIETLADNCIESESTPATPLSYAINLENNQIEVEVPVEESDDKLDNNEEQAQAEDTNEATPGAAAKEENIKTDEAEQTTTEMNGTSDENSTEPEKAVEEVVEPEIEQTKTDAAPESIETTEAEQATKEPDTTLGNNTEEAAKVPEQEEVPATIEETKDESVPVSEEPAQEVEAKTVETVEASQESAAEPETITSEEANENIKQTTEDISEIKNSEPEPQQETVQAEDKPEEIQVSTAETEQ